LTYFLIAVKLSIGQELQYQSDLYTDGHVRTESSPVIQNNSHSFSSELFYNITAPFKKFRGLCLNAWCRLYRI